MYRVTLFDNYCLITILKMFFKQMGFFETVHTGVNKSIEVAELLSCLAETRRFLKEFSSFFSQQKVVKKTFLSF